MATTHILYLHGFRSSPKSPKAQRIAARLQSRQPEVVWHCPQLPPSPRLAMLQISETMALWPLESTAVIGSSLGGFYAAWLAARTGCRSVLLNPSVYPARDLGGFISQQRDWHDPADQFFFQPEFVNELKAMEQDLWLAQVPSDSASKTLAIIAKGDEVLDWREMVTRHASARIHLLEGRDHGLTDFEDLMDIVFDFLHLA